MQASSVSSSLVVQPKGTPLDVDAANLSVLSYNLLAPAFVRTVDARTGEPQAYAAFEWAEPASEVLDWDARQPRLLAELQACKADVLCLQEVQFERDPQNGDIFTLPAWLKLDGYNARLPAQKYLEQMAERNKRVLNTETAIGNAVLYRTDRLEVVDDDKGQSNTLVAVCLRGLTATPLAMLDPTVVFSVHLDAKTEGKRVDQLKKCCSFMRQIGVREGVIAGDMNTECLPGSCVSAFIAGTPEPTEAEMNRECASALRLSTNTDDELQDGAADNVASDAPTDVQLQEWKALWHEAASTVRAQRLAFSHVATGATRASYDHGKTCGPCVSWRLDHILYTSRTLLLCNSWAALEADPEAAAKGLPNHTCPSDHLPVAAAFRPAPTPSLNDLQKAALFSKFNELEARQKTEHISLTEQLEQSAPLPPTDDGTARMAADDTAQSQTKKNKKANKKERPSPEMIAFIQEQRRQLRELKENHRLQRLELVRGLSDLEQDALDAITCTETWVDGGGPIQDALG